MGDEPNSIAYLKLTSRSYHLIYTKAEMVCLQTITLQYDTDLPDKVTQAGPFGAPSR